MTLNKNIINKQREPPVRLCCGERHFGPVCPDKKVQCCLCFNRFSKDELNEVNGVKEDVCINCATKEKENE